MAKRDGVKIGFLCFFVVAVVVTWLFVSLAMHTTLHAQTSTAGHEIKPIRRDSFATLSKLASDSEEKLRILDQEIVELKKRKAQHDLASQMAESMLRGGAAATSGMMPSLLPAQQSEWEEYTDQISGRAYFHNRATGETRWERPDVVTTKDPNTQAATEASPRAQLIQPAPSESTRSEVSVLPSKCEVLDGVDFLASSEVTNCFLRVPPFHRKFADQRMYFDFILWCGDTRFFCLCR
jgi:hypothetical protein